MKKIIIIILCLIAQEATYAQFVPQIYPKAATKGTTMTIYRGSFHNTYYSAYGTWQSGGGIDRSSEFKLKGSNEADAVYVHRENLDVYSSTSPGPMILEIKTQYNGTQYLDQHFTLLADGASGEFVRGNVKLDYNGGAFTGVTTGDLDGDGFEDIVAITQNNRKLIWFKNLEGDRFSGVKVIESFSSGCCSGNVELGDMNKDGKLDIVIANYDVVSTYLNQGDGVFATRTDMTTWDGSNYYYDHTPYVGAIQIVDLDFDGRLDVLWLNQESSTYGYRLGWLRGNGYGGYYTITGANDGTPAEAFYRSADVQLRPRAADMDGNPKDMEILTRSGYINTLDFSNYASFGGTLGHTTSPPAVTTSKVGNFVADWQGDGNLEATSYKYTMDIDADGDMDAVSASGDLYWYENIDGSGPSSTRHLIGDITGNVTFTDMDHDGDMDIIATDHKSIYYFRNIWKGNELVSISNADFTTKAPIINGSNYHQEVANGVDLETIVPQYELSRAASGSASSTDYSNEVIYTVTSEHGAAKNWRIKLVNVPNSPELEVTVEGETARITWAAIDYAESYNILIEQNLGGSWNVVNEIPGNISATQLEFNANANTPYRATIRSKNEFNSTSDPAILEFTAPPSAPSIASATVDCGDMLDIAWQEVSGAIEYRLEIANDDAFSQVVVDSVLSGLQWSGDLEGGLSYYLRLYSIGTEFESAASASKAFSSPPAVPTGIILSQFTASSLLVSWDNIPSAEAYRVYIYLGTGTLEAQSPALTVDTSHEITGLTSGTEYTARLKSVISGSGSCSESTISEGITFTTVPSAPSNLSATVTTSSADMTWSETRGATSYQVQVSESDVFNDLLMDSTVQETQVRILDLFESWDYFFRVRAINESGTSVFSTRDFTTQGDPNVPPTGMDLSSSNIDENAPTSTVIATITTTDGNTVESFTYRLVAGAGDTDNAEFVVQGDQLLSNASYNFESKSSYSIRLQTSDKGDLTYEKSFVITITNKNDAPHSLSLSNASFIAFTEANTTIGTLSVVDEDNGDIPVFSIDSETDFFIIEGSELKNAVQFENEEDSVFLLDIRATDSEGAFISTSFEIFIERFVDDEAPLISDLTENQDFLSGTEPIELSVLVSDFRIQNVTFHTRPLTNESFDEVDVSDQSSPYIITINEDMLEGNGLEYYVSAVDETGNVSTSDYQTISLSFNESASPNVSSITRFGGKVEDYEIISIPFSFEGTGNRVQEIFNEYNGGIPDKKIWRLIAFNSSDKEADQTDLQNMVASSQIRIGEGYFFNAKELIEVKVGAGSINTQDPQEIVLKPGWNLIGNPYIIDIDWSKVRSRNGIAEVGPLRVIDPTNPSGWPESRKLEKYKGGFVQLLSETNQTITISYMDKSSSGGRQVASPERPDHELFVPLTLIQGNNSGTGTLGMHTEAKLGVDAYDALTLPRWFRYLEIKFEHPEYSFGDFSQDIVPIDDNYIWSFTVASDQNGASSLHWGELLETIPNLKLLDVADQQIIDMTKKSGYSFDLKESKSFKIFYSIDPNELFTSERIALGQIYPNPVSDKISIPLTLPQSQSAYEVRFKVLDLTGRLIYEEPKMELHAGSHEIGMNIPSFIKSGAYLSKITITAQGIKKEFTNRFIVK